MNIWFDTNLAFQDLTNTYESHRSYESCPKDSTDANPSLPNTPIISRLTEEATLSLYTHTFTCSKTLCTQKCDDSLWLVCDPTRQGRVVVIDTEIYRLLTSFRFPKTLQDAIEGSSISSSSVGKAVRFLTSSGFLLDLDQFTSLPNQQPDQLLAAWLHITNACNLRCHYCYVQKDSEHMADDVSKQAVDAVIRSATRYHHQHIHLTYAGGEATLQLPQVLAIHDYALEQAQEHKLGLSASMISNGVVMPQWAIEQLKQRQIGLGISLDGIGENHDQQRPFVNGKGSFAFVDRTITRLLAGGLVPSINVTVTQRNLDELPRLLEYILQRDLPFGLSYYRDNECSTHLSDLQFTDDRMIDGMRAAFAYIEQHLPKRPLLGLLVDKARTGTPRQHTCGVGRNYLAIDQRGGIAKCHADITNTVATIYDDNPLQVIRENRQGVQAVTVEEKEGCRACEWRYWCTGGCPLLTYRATGRIPHQISQLQYLQGAIPEALRLEALRLLKYETPITI